MSVYFQPLQLLQALPLTPSTPPNFHCVSLLTGLLWSRLSRNFNISRLQHYCPSQNLPNSSELPGQTDMAAWAVAFWKHCRESLYLFLFILVCGGLAHHEDFCDKTLALIALQSRIQALGY
jgi:hypothetical protein